MDGGRNIVVVASLTRSLTNFRRDLLREIAQSGPHTVTACAPEDDPAVAAELADMGIDFETVPMRRAAADPLSDLRTLLALRRIFRKRQADIVIAYTQKPIVYGGLAARSTGARFHALQSGLGYTFSEENKSAGLRQAVTFLYRAALAKAETVFVFNDADEADMRRLGMIRPGQRVVRVAGSGVDPQRYPQMPVPDGPTVFLLVARLMRDKGLEDYAAAARTLRERHPELEFRVLGPFDPNPASISKAQLDTWVESGAIRYLGETDDVRPHLADCSVFVLPSYHREGLPRSILEAMSTGRAVITTDMPGCRDTVEEGVNGFLVPPRDPDALIRAAERFAADPGLAGAMGERSRERVLERFDVRLVNDRILRTIGLRGNEGTGGPPPRRTKAEPLKRGFDIAASLLLLAFASPLLFLVMIAIRARMGRPVFFRQRRAGKGGRPFTMVKFRTMRDEADAKGRPLPDAARVTPLGRFLRRSRLDELPELLHILRGEMSFVGPRPLLPDAPINQGEAGRLRLAARPGLTGWAQVNGNTLLSDEEKAALDLHYVRRRSFLFDLRILVLTLGVVLFGERLRRQPCGSRA